MSLWIVPVAFLALVGLLALATHLESQRPRVLVRMTMRSRSTTPEHVEAVIAAELAPILAQYGMQRPS